MDKKSLVTVMICGVLVAMIFGAYLLGSNINYAKGYNDGVSHGISIGALSGRHTLYDNGYKAGYQAGLINATGIG